MPKHAVVRPRPVESGARNWRFLMTWTKQVSTIPAHKNIATPEVLTKFAFHRGVCFIGSFGQGRFAHRKSGPWSPTETAWNRATVRKSPSALNSRGWNLQLP